MIQNIDNSLSDQHFLITGGAGFIGSTLTAALLNRGTYVTVVDSLVYGGESLMQYISHPRFRFIRGDVGHLQELDIQQSWDGAESSPFSGVIHLAAIVGYPACKAADSADVWRVNLEGVKTSYDWANRQGANRFLFASTYSVYGIGKPGEALNETSPLNPQSLYAESKIAGEEYLLANGAQSSCAPVILRFATLFGVSPRMRFDLIVNQFTLEAYLQNKLVIFEQSYSRAYLHLLDAIEGILLVLGAPLDDVGGQVFNVGLEQLNRTKDEILEEILQFLPDTQVTYKDAHFDGDMRDVRVAFGKFRELMQFNPRRDITDGIAQVLQLLRSGLLKDPYDPMYRNAEFIIN